MAQLKDSVVSGNLRVTDGILTDTIQTKTIKIPTASGGSTYGAGTSGQVVKSNGTSAYWANDTTYTAQTTSVGSAATGTVISADDITSWSAGTLPTATITGENLTLNFGTLPTLEYTAKTIPNITVTSKTVVTGITAS